VLRGSCLLPCSRQKQVSGLLSPQMLLTTTSSTTQKSQAEDQPVFPWLAVPASFFHFLFFFNRRNLQATCGFCQRKASFRKVIQPPSASPGLFSSLHYPILFLILHKKMAPSSSPTYLGLCQLVRPGIFCRWWSGHQLCPRPVQFLQGSTAADTGNTPSSQPGIHMSSSVFGFVPPPLQISSRVLKAFVLPPRPWI